MTEFKERIAFTKSLEDQRHMKEDMEVLYSSVETEQDERKRVNAWEKLKALRAKAVKHAIKHGICYTEPEGLRW